MKITHLKQPFSRKIGCLRWDWKDWQTEKYRFIYILHPKRKQYFIVSKTFLPFITDLSLHEPSEHSDHWPIILTKITTSQNYTHDRKKLGNEYKTSCFTSCRCNIKWNKDMEQEVREYFNSPSFLESLSLNYIPQGRNLLSRSFQFDVNIKI